MRRVILFDLFNTLVPGGIAGEREAVNEKIAALLGVDPYAYNQAFLHAWYERFMGALGDLVQTVDTIARRVGGAPAREDVAYAAGLRQEMTAALIAAVPAHTLATLGDLRAAGWRIGLVSNTTAESPDRWRESRLPPYFDVAVFSSELGAVKPDPAIYLAACAHLDVSPDDCFYLGDGADRELLGASVLGMYAIRTTEHGDTDPTWPGPTISSITDLPALIATLTREES